MTILSHQPERTFVAQQKSEGRIVIAVGFGGDAVAGFAVILAVANSSL
jgi:hypothetical protein